MRGDHLLREERKNKDNNTRNSSNNSSTDSSNDNCQNSNKIIDEIEERIISQTAVLKSRKINQDLEEWEKDCEDLDGWDN